MLFKNMSLISCIISSMITPIYLELDIDVSYFKGSDKYLSKKTNWRKCTSNDTKQYNAFTDFKLSKLDIDMEVITCQNMKCDIHHDALNIIYDNIIGPSQDMVNQHTKFENPLYHIPMYLNYIL